MSGRGVSIAVLDTGVARVDDLAKPQSRLLAFADFVNGKAEAYDDNGHGTHVASIAAGNGYRSKGLYMGIAPGSGIVGVKTLDSGGKGTAVEMLAGLQWTMDNREKYNIRIINLSVGAADFSKRDPLVRAVEAAWDSGVCVVAAAGNNGPAPGSVTSPGVSRKVITVGASDDADTVEIEGNAVQNYSGRGPTLDCIVKPDVLAPGADIISAKAEGNYIKMSGTSMATPIVSGAVALLLERSPGLTPDDVKYMLRICAADLNFPRNQQGCGVLDIGAVLNEEVKHVRDL
ncbi:MAG: S8 family peptidase [Defluviitaleaceae bacterium]|nr:S8 family peptidase [Defluviitaleaceae bacterium]